MARNWTEVNNNRGNVLRTSYQKGIISDATVKPDSNIHYLEIDVSGAPVTITGDASTSQTGDEIRVTIKNTGGSEASLYFSGDFENTSASISVGETEATSFFCDGSSFVLSRLDSLQNTIVVNQSNVSTTLGGVIDSTKEYFIDGIIDLGATQITVPPTGITLRGYSFDLSGLISSEDNYSMIVSETAVIGSGNILGFDFHICVNGLNSKVYDIYDATGFNAFEYARINYNDCTSLGDIHNYRQGLETGTGRFGGSPSLTLHGTWLGGFRITTSIVRSMSDTTTEPLFKAGTAFVMNSRFLTDMNVDLGTLQPLLDFAPSNFTNPSTLQLKGCIVSRDGVINSTDSNITPNMSNTDICSDWDNNQGLRNTFVGGKAQVTTQSETTISSASTFYNINGTFTTNNLQHFDSPAQGQLRHLGKDPIEFNVLADFNIESTANNVIAIRITKYDSISATFSDFLPQLRQVNSFVGGRDVAFFTISGSITLEQNDYIKFQVANETGTANVTLEDNSFYTVQER
tara:strand:- start:1468 stop:3018 length:1551 start_codon:yes stop_codon:yes gene_type:complete